MTSVMPFNLSLSLPLLFLLILFILPSCSQLTYTPIEEEDLQTQVDKWVAANEYGKALEAIYYVQPEHPQYLELKNRQDSMLELAHDYEKQVRAEVDELIKEQQWPVALNLIEQAKNNYPDSLLIYQTGENLHRTQLEQIEKLDQRLLIERAKWLQKALPLYKDRLNTDPRNQSLKSYKNQLHYEAELLAQQLTVMAEEAVERKHYKTARLRLSQANELSSTPQRQQRLVEIEKVNRQNTKNIAKQKQQKEQQEQEKKDTQYQQALYNNIERSYNRGWLSITQSLIQQLDEEEQQSPEIVALKQEIDKAIERRVELLSTEANKFYEEENYKEAIDKWYQILSYQPDNETAKENIQRAEKVIEKINQLREKQRQQ